MFALLWRIDTACHWLSRWHLLPRFASRPLCNWCDRRLLASAPDDFYVEDEPLEDVLAAFNRGEKHLTEKTRREIAYHHRDEVVEGSGRLVQPKRFGPPTDDELDMTEEAFDEAFANGEPVEVVGLRTFPRLVGFGCEHMSMTAGNVTLTEVKGWCGCDMQPIYATASY